MNTEQERNLAIRFTYHPPSPEQIPKYNEIRNGAHAYAKLLYELCPKGPEFARALNKLDEVVMLANAAIARDVE